MGEAALHGGIVPSELRALGVDPREVLDLSVNVNPFGPCDVVRRAVLEAAIDRYPDPTCQAARRAVAARAGVPEARVVLGNGAAELLWGLARAALAPGDRALVVEPAFSEMRRAAACAGAVVMEHRASPDDAFALDVRALDACIAAARPRLVYVASPANPTGVAPPLAEIEALARRHPGALFVADVSFLSLSTRAAELAEPRDPRVVWLRSITKDHALAGLRAGFALAPERVAATLERERAAWAVSAFVQAAVAAAMTDEAERFVEGSRRALLDAQGALAAALVREGLRVYPSDTIYVLADLGHGASATELRRRLLASHRILVRDATSFGLPTHVRVAARPADARVRLVSAMQKELRP